MTLRYYQRKHGTRLYPEYLCQKEQIEQAGDHLCRASCLVRAWMRRSPTCCWHNSLLWPSIRACRSMKNCVPRPRRRGGCVPNRWSVPGSAAELAQRRFLQVDPENRFVADVLEADWNARLRELVQGRVGGRATQCRRTVKTDCTRTTGDCRPGERFSTGVA